VDFNMAMTVEEDQVLKRLVPPIAICMVNLHGVIGHEA
jgi:hypothetical protein